MYKAHGGITASFCSCLGGPEIWACDLSGGLDQMRQIHSFYGLKWTGLCLCASLAVAAGLNCPGGIGGEPTPNPNPAGGNTAPRLIITNIITDQGNFNAQKGVPVVVQFIGEDA